MYKGVAVEEPTGRRTQEYITTFSSSRTVAEKKYKKYSPHQQQYV